MKHFVKKYTLKLKRQRPYNPFSQKVSFEHKYFFSFSHKNGSASIWVIILDLNTIVLA